MPRGRDVTLWQSAEMLEASGRNLSEGISNSKITQQEWSGLVGSATRRFNDLEYWIDNVRINATLLRSLGEVRTSLGAVQRDSRLITQPAHFAPRSQTPSRSATLFATPAVFSPNDLNGAVGIAKAYLVNKYGIKQDGFGNMGAREMSTHHEVTLETRQTRYVLSVDIRRGVVLKEKSYPKAGRRRGAPR